MRLAELTFLHKKNTKTKFANYRPLSLTNCDYKILTKTLTNALNPAIDKLVHTDQTGFVKGSRWISDNGMLLSSIIDFADFAEEGEVEGAMVFLDFQKAFDSLSHSFMVEVLRKAGIPNDFIRWVKLLYADPLATPLINGKHGEAFQVGRGIRQGCPLSPILFCLCVEPMAALIRAERNIGGVYIDKVSASLKLSQFADDTTLLVRNAKELSIAFAHAAAFCKAAGMQLNE
jgi:hypothetical protein